ncbi:MAG: hypothetical protein V7647_3818, partial [Acidobacteriota bacterium]
MLAAAVVFAGPAGAQADSPILQRYFRLHQAQPHAVTGPAWRDRAYRHALRFAWPAAPLSLASAAPKSAQATAPTAAAAPDSEAQRATAAMSDVDRAVLARINGVRAQHGLRALVVSAGLTAAAHQHSVEMVARGYFAHESADGSSFDKRIRRYYKGLRSAGENIAY